MPGGTTKITSATLETGRAHPTEIAGERAWAHAPDTLPSHQTTIMKVPDSN